MAGDLIAEPALDVMGQEDVSEAAKVSEGTLNKSTQEAVASPGDPNPSQEPAETVKPTAASSPSASTATGKRAIADDADDAGEGHLEEDSPPRKKARKGSAGTSSSAGESTPSPKEPSRPAKPGIAVSGLRTSFAQPAAPGLSGVRTSFGTSSQTRVTKDNIDFVMHTPLTSDERNQLVMAARNYETKDVKPLHKRKLDWIVGPIRSEFLIGSTWLEIWESAIDKWCTAFLADNQANIAQIGLAPALLKNGFQRRLDVEVGEGFPATFKNINKVLLKHPETSRLKNFAEAFKPDLEKKAKKQARNAAKSTSADSDTVESAIATEQQSQSLVKNSGTPTKPEDTLANAQADVDQDDGSEGQDQRTQDDMEDGEINSGDASSVDMAVDEDAPPISQAELEQRRHYFPNVPDHVAFCLTCAQVGHTTEGCLELTCKFCQGPHFKYECPTRQRCAKCKQLGHTKPSCPEKLAVAPGEVAIECAICEGHDHTETNCIQLYQIYHPKPGRVSKVRSLPVFCYACGTEGHYGGDCPLADPSVPPTKVWTMSTASLYIDPNSEQVALSYRNGLPPPREMSKPVIPGRSIKPQTHVIFEESDGEGDGDFISFDNGGPANRNKRNKRSNNGPAIQIASNISFGGNAGARPPFNQQSQQQQPPPPPPKKQKGPAQPPKDRKKPSNDPTPATKTVTNRRNRNNGPAPPNPQPNSTSGRSSQPPPKQNQGSGGRGGGNSGRGRGGFSQLASKRPRRTRRG
ncbi:hypothetical protein N0V93_000677 [Gnomoniopsis smithogilvyi]|uniref:CCHC-type domain-containing protein n=1 Tax=Gnomoniopsis smithogilvyi TaxID=1191159 RepID=A0A9W8Z2F1_9PEZI|nr:hypothetical protein N0V93_000677 [Gnomoniopsis smithogilvyi]